MARQKEDGGRTYRLKETQQSYQLDVKCSPCFGVNLYKLLHKLIIIMIKGECRWVQIKHWPYLIIAKGILQLFSILLTFNMFEKFHSKQFFKNIFTISLNRFFKKLNIKKLKTVSQNVYIFQRNKL